MQAPYDPIPIRNDSGEEIPSFGVVEPTGEVRDGAIVVTRPTADGRRGVLVNGDGAIPVGGGGDAYAAPRVRVLVAEEPDLFDELGATAGEWHLSAAAGGGGFVHIGGFAGGVSNFLRAAGATAADAGGTTSAGCLRRFRSMRATDCITVEVTAGTGLCAGGADQSFDGGWSDSAGGWVGDEYVWTPIGLGLLTVWVGTDGQPAAKLTVAGTDYRGTYDGCTAAGRVRFLFGGETLCPDSGSGVEACGDHVIDVSVGCAPCGVAVCDDPDYTMPRRVCFLAEDLEASVYADGTFTLGAVAVPLVYLAGPPPAALDWQPGAAFSHFWYGEADAEITASTSTNPAFQVGETYRVRAMLYVSPPDGTNCDEYGLIVRAGTGAPNGFAAYHQTDATGGPPNPLPFSDASPTFTNLYGALAVLTAAGIALTEGECPGGTGGGAGDSACCMEAGESLESHPDLEVVVPDGANAGTYTAVWDAVDGRYEFDDANLDPVYITCAEQLGTSYLDMVSTGTSSGGAASGVSCDPFGVVFPGYVLASTGPITVALA